ncbi:TolC family protein [Sphingobacterium thalpophilum]|uniref:Outer membrane efflux protein BepC n=1 Tax=Sphingobacterium thalpophilum TaxID=259 RepID=A0A4U9W3E9_9SPHI|nr:MULTISPECIES: TolC family protein [Sphingobacterium]MCW8311688.1 TolC family protein [Sphingobacterium sp. InxBP1]VTR53211.1 Outer membrane efflux protein BepC precursor [Sphingobacterium thalpophilum]
MKRYTIIMLLFCTILFQAHAQQTLTLEEALTTTLANNFNILLARNDSKIDMENTSLGSAGMLPAVTGNFNRSNSVQNSRQVRADGQIQQVSNAKNDNMSYGVNLNWTIFDGFGMFARRDRFKEIQRQGEAEIKFEVISQLSEVIATYYNLVQQKRLLDALDTTITLSQYRVALAENRLEIGKGSKLDLLNAKVDLNTDQTNLLRQQESFKNTKTYLNQLMTRDLDLDFGVEDEMELDQNLKLGDLLTLADQQNPQIQLAIINKRIAELNLKSVKAERYPKIGLNTGYNWNESHSSLGFSTENKNRGLTYGVSASVNIFNGFLQNRNERIAKFQLQSSELLIQQQKQDIQAQVRTLFQTYVTNMQLANVEKKNEELAKENLNITMDKFRIGTITTLEVRTAQVNYINAMTRSYTAQYEAKLSEIRLKELTGETY